jgi:hypothetical protein
MSDLLGSIRTRLTAYGVIGGKYILTLLYYRKQISNNWLVDVWGIVLPGLILASILTGCLSSPDSKGGARMPNKDITKLIREHNPEDEEGLENLATVITQESMKAPREVVTLLHTDNKVDFRKAAVVLLGLGDLALTPLMESLNPKSPEGYVWDMESIINIQIENRMKIAKVLDKMLLDKRSIKLPELPHEEEAFIPRRVCDEAYLMLRRLLSFEDDEDEMFLNADTFLNMTENERDVEITRFKKSKRWTPLSRAASGLGS